MPYFSATFFIVVIINCWWSWASTERSEDRGDLELAGRDLVVPVLDGMPSLNSSRSSSIMKASTRSGMAPK